MTVVWQAVGLKADNNLINLFFWEFALGISVKSSKSYHNFRSRAQLSQNSAKTAKRSEEVKVSASSGSVDYHVSGSSGSYKASRWRKVH